MSKRVLINTVDKEGITDFAKDLMQKYTFDIIATENTYEYLKGNGIACELFNSGDKNFDMVVCNFEELEKYINKNIDEEEVLKSIDDNGLSLLLNASKNYKHVIAVSSKNQYKQVLEKFENNDVNDNFLKELAQKAFFKINKITSQIAKIMDKSDDIVTIAEEKTYDLLYGENPHQKAALYSDTMLEYEIIANKQLSYNNFVDVNTAVSIAAEFYDVCAVTITRHGMPCAVALGATIDDAYVKALDCDPVSAMGGVAAFTKKVDKSMTKQISSMFLEVIAAPDFDEEVIDALSQSSMKLIKIKTPLKEYKHFVNREIKITPFGILSQEPDKTSLEKDSFKLVTKKKPTAEMVEDMVFAWKIAKHARSNSAIVVKDLKTVGIAQGQSNRIEAIDIALDRACENSKDAILATDGAITTTDGIFDAAQARISAIIQPGNSTKDKDIAKAADKYELVMITTGIRQYNHK